MRKYIWYMVGTATKFSGNWAENGAVDGDVAARGRMSRWKAGCPGWMGRMSGLDGPDVRARRAGCPGSGSGDERDEHRVERSNPGKIRRNLWMEIGGKRMGS